MKKIFCFMAFLIVSTTLLAVPELGPKVIYEEDFSDGTMSDYWTVFNGDITADGTTPGVFLAEDPDGGFGKLSFGTAEGTQILFDLYELIVTDLGYPESELANMTFSYDLAQTNGTGGFYAFNGGFVNGGQMRHSQMLPTGDDSGLRGSEAEAAGAFGGWTYAGETSFGSSWGGVPVSQQGAIHPGIEKYHRLNRGQWKWQRLRHEFDVEQYVTMKLYQDYNMDGEYVYVAGTENVHPNDGTPWQYPEQYTLENENGVVSWFVDNVTVQLNNPFVDWNLIFEDNFNSGSIDPQWTTSGNWTVLGEDDPNAVNPPWGAMADNMAASEPNSFFTTNIPATNAGELTALSFDVEQSNGSNGDFPIFFGFGDAESDEYYVEYAGPALAYSDTSGAMVMQSSTDGNGTDPFDLTTDSWWSFGAGVDGMAINHDKSTHVDMIINPWENYPTGSVSVYFDGELAAKWDDFRGIFSFDEIFFGIRNNVWEETLNDGAGGYTPTWNFDNIKVYTRESQCGDVGYYNPVDFNEDCVVDIIDFAEFASEWMSCTFPDMTCFQ